MFFCESYVVSKNTFFLQNTSGGCFYIDYIIINRKAYRKSGNQDPKVKPYGGALGWDPLVGPYSGTLRGDSRVGS